MKMVERMARAIWEAREKNFPPRVQRKTWDDLDAATGLKAMVHAEALAALKAMREPNEEMIGATLEAMWPGPEIIYDDAFTSEREMMLAGWDAAIDAAIKEAEAE